MKKSRLAALAAIMTALVLCAAVLTVRVGTGLADAGGFSGESDFDFSDFDSDWGSSSDDWDSGSDWGSNWDTDSGSGFGGGGFSFFPFFFSNDTGGGDYYTGSSGTYASDGTLTESRGSGSGSFFLLILLIALIVLFVYLRKKGQKPAAYKPQGTPKTPSNLRPITEYQQLDPGFDPNALCEKLSNGYVRLQNAWTAGDLEPVRVLLSEGLYAQFERQLNEMKQRGQINYVDDISVMDVRLVGFEQQGGMDRISALLQTRIKDYTVDADGKLLSGSKDREKFMRYEWTLERPSGRTTTADSGITKVTCPSCGAPLEIASTGKCPYCGSIVRVEEHDFVVSAIRGISQQTM